MYVSEHESAAEKYCREHQVNVPTIASIDELVHYLTGESRYRVERSFDRLQQGFRELLLTIADVDLSDLKSSHHTGMKLHHYTAQGQKKIAKAFRKVRLLSKAFPEGITESEFSRIDREQGE